LFAKVPAPAEGYLQDRENPAQDRENRDCPSHAYFGLTVAKTVNSSGAILGFARVCETPGAGLQMTGNPVTVNDL
jgi:hypothetical protein